MNMNYFRPARAARKAFDDALASERARPLTPTMRLAVVAMMIMLVLAGLGSLIEGARFLFGEASSEPSLLVLDAPFTLVSIAVLLILSRSTIFYCTLGVLVVTKGPVTDAKS